MRSALDYLQGHYDCHVQLRGKPPTYIEVSPPLYKAYEEALGANQRHLYTPVGEPITAKSLMYRGCIIREYTNWSARVMV